MHVTNPSRARRASELKQVEQIAQRWDNACARRICLAVEQHGGKTGSLCALNIQLQTIADVKNSRWGDHELVGSSSKNRCGGFWEANLTRNYDAVEIGVQLESAQQGAKALIPIGNHAEFDSLGAQGLQRGNDLLKHMPCARVRKTFVKFAKKSTARLAFD